MSKEFVIFNCHRENVLDIEYKKKFLLSFCVVVYISKIPQRNVKKILKILSFLAQFESKFHVDCESPKEITQDSFL